MIELEIGGTSTRLNPLSTGLPTWGQSTWSWTRINLRVGKGFRDTLFQAKKEPSVVLTATYRYLMTGCRDLGVLRGGKATLQQSLRH